MTSAASTLWKLLGGDPAPLASLRLRGGPVLASRFDVTGFAQDAVGVASLAVAELLAARLGAPLGAVEVDSVDAAAAFRSEALLAPQGWSLPPPWDPIAGDYQARDRWLRLHTNYDHHRAAAFAALGLPASAGRAEVTAAVARSDAASIEAAVVEAGGCAAAMYTRDEWLATAHGRATATEEPIALTTRPTVAAPLAPLTAGEAPLAGVRVLELTRVLAGPVCARFLAAHGADVLRIDPPGFVEVAALVPDTTAGKRCASLALDTDEGRARFFELVRGADVLLHGLRPGALARLGLDEETLRALNPSLITATLDAYGWQGPWRERRGFDSLVQMSAGIAAHNASPAPLPAQALDHGTGYLLAAAIGRALTGRALHQRPAAIRASLLGAANHLIARGPTDPVGSAPPWPDHVLETADTAWGPVRRVRCPGRIAGTTARWTHAPGPLGSASPRWL